MEADDPTLVERIRRGDAAAAEMLVRRYQGRLYHTLLQFVGHADDAADAVQDAFLNAFQSLHLFKGDAQFYTWLYRIAMNAAISQRRKQRVLLHADVPGHASGFDPADPSPGAVPGAEAEQADEVARLHTALARLSPEHRAVLVMKEIEGQKYEQIAEVLEVPIGTVRSRLHRARMELRDLLSESE